jgi:hypothetical protein
MTGIERIAAERERQVSAEGWTPEHDDEHADGSLARAAARYAEQAGNDWSESTIAPYGWPWDDKWWKPTGDAVRDLTKAGALIAAEIDRLERSAAAEAEARDERRAA